MESLPVETKCCCPLSELCSSEQHSGELINDQLQALHEAISAVCTYNSAID